ncbi:uncharacterized protein LOC122509096 [Leptopilina heterotoma]|uniref:uncharacterized protein LOC122509096 n=1 Tax=Leptopilina heterotoma TaxID=63436 RepID=UPI001CA8F98B|nr:uncharacterized protein LOC122509096 [Leptopilina heterotoma]
MRKKKQINFILFDVKNNLSKMAWAVKLNIFMALFFVSNASNVRWNTNAIIASASPVVVNSFASSCNKLTYYFQYHHKTHFGIIVKQKTILNVTVTSSEEIKYFRFFCYTQTPEHSINEINFKGKTKFSVIIEANFNCVPMITDSYQVPVEVEIRTSNWIRLPTFDTNKYRLSTSKDAENKFFDIVKIYGFVENYYTQMLLTSGEIKEIREANLSLYIGLQNQANVIQYYDSLVGSKRIIHSPGSEYGKYTEERTVLFLTRTFCHDSLFSSDEQLSFTKKSSIGCRNKDESCNYVRKDCTSAASLGTERVAYTSVLPWLQPPENTRWILLHEFGHYYDVEEYFLGFGYVAEVWNNIFAAFYQHKLELDGYWMTFPDSDETNATLNYQNGVPIHLWNYREKLHFFISIFGYDGSDGLFREFAYRHFQVNKATSCNLANIIPTLVETFLDLRNINILPYLKKVVDFKNYTFPLVYPDLELRALSGNSIMPAIDFNKSSGDIQRMSQERDFRPFSSLILLPKVEKENISVQFSIHPFNLNGECLYLNNECHVINNEMFDLKILANVYSIYIAAKKGDKLYMSEVIYRVISESSKIRVHVKEISKNEVFLPLVYYVVEALGYDDEMCFKIFINYQDKTISISQLTKNIHSVFKNEVYFSVKLTRNGETIFNHKFMGISDDNNTLNVIHDFKEDDLLHIFHAEPYRLYINDRSLEYIYNETFNDITLVLTKKGLLDIKDNDDTIFLKKCTIKATGENDKMFLRIFTNYDNRMISLSQYSKNIHYNFEDKLYFSVKLLRNETEIFEYKFLGISEDDVLNVNYNFEINDFLCLSHVEQGHILINDERINDYDADEGSYSNCFSFSENGLLNIANKHLLFIRDDIDRISTFNQNYKIDLSYNPLFDFFVDQLLYVYNSVGLGSLISSD